MDEGATHLNPSPGGYRNIHGRKAGRGARPYLIVVKLLSVAAFAGGLICVLVLALSGPPPQDLVAWRAQADLIRRLFLGVIIPGVTVAMVTGLLLFASIWRVMLRMRWFMTKAILVIVCVPSLHLFMRGRSQALRAALNADPPDLAAVAEIHSHLLAGTLAALAFAVAALILGRIKPRLGQDYGRTFARTRTPGDG